MIKDLFKKALEIMIEEKEFERLINFAPSIREKRLIEQDKNMLETISKTIKIEEFPFIPILANLSSANVFRDVIVYMAEVENRIVKGINKDGK